MKAATTTRPHLQHSCLPLSGFVRLGDFLGEEALADGRLLPLLEICHDPEPRPITLLTPPALQRLPRIRAFMDFLQEKQRG